MKTTNNTVLITGGTAGIGLELAKQFNANGNNVIITGRDAARLQNAVDQLPGVTGIVSDVTRAADVDQLVARLQAEFPRLNVVINNAGRAFVHDLAQADGTYEKAAEEIATNYLSIIRLNEKLLPILRQQAEAAIVDVSSIVAYTPNHIIATYSATKAALHSYTVSLRHALAKNSRVKVFELMPPLVNTEFSSEIGGGEHGIPPSVVAEELLKAFENNDYEVRVGNTAYIYELSRKSPDEAFAVLNPA
ncbi:SDR family oxidoreductase [Dawidia soli]|uniref:SDR family NAD(P)-dependent oxidoreductase n=1 Tax=Dawidia soli TaxID=2782352 RepID=A0AAP2DBS8_9BACT|nr:SDR family NAD(P)-dependent oxidoreductase [Dawidia soli]MBT1688824.1 SDR family NAD(P)-dependent oxidoreductase [Dawidia soli]